MKYFLNFLLAFLVFDFSAQNETTVYAWHMPSAVPQKMVPMCWVRDSLDTYYPSYHITDFQAIADHLASMPEGKRVIFLWDHHQKMAYNEADYLRDDNGQIQGYMEGDSLIPFPPVWWDSGAVYVRKKHEDLFRNLYELGAKLDLVVLDYENKIANFMFKGVNVADYEDNYLTAIENDPRFVDMVDDIGTSDLTPMINYFGQDLYLKFNDYWLRKRSEYINTAIFDPLLSYFPNAKFHNYQDVLVTPMVPVPDLNGHRIYCCGNTGAYSGTHQTDTFYGWMGHITTTQVPEGATSFPFTPFNGLLYEAKKMKSIASSSIPFAGWIAYKSFIETNPEGVNYVSYSNNEYYDEMLFHLLLSGPDHLVYWNPSPEFGAPGTIQSHQSEADWVNYLIDEYDEMWGAAPPTHTTFYPNDLSIDWDEPFVLTSRESDSLTLWRLSPKLDSAHPTPLSFRNQDLSVMQFEFENTMLSFPEGTEILDINASPESGLWLAKQKPSTLQLSEKVKTINAIVSYPNPATNELCLFSDSEDLLNCEYKVIDVMQREIKVNFKQDQSLLKLDVSNLVNGTYFIVSDYFYPISFCVAH